MRDTGNGIDVKYRIEPGQIALDQLSDSLTRSAYGVIAKMKTSKIPLQPHSNIVNNQNFRIDLQGIVWIQNAYYYNLQLQRNIARRPGQSTTYATVLVPRARVGDQYMNTRRLRNAFIKSFLERKNVRIIVTQYSQRNGRSLEGEDEEPEKHFIQDEHVEDNVNEENLESFESELE